MGNSRRAAVFDSGVRKGLVRSVWQTLKAERDQLGESHDEPGRQADADMGAAAGSAQRTTHTCLSCLHFRVIQVHLHTIRPTPLHYAILPILVNADSHVSTIAIKTWTQNHCQVPRTHGRQTLSLLLPPAITPVFCPHCCAFSRTSHTWHHTNVVAFGSDFTHSG